MKGGMDLVVVKHHRCVENLVVSVGKRRKDEGNGTVDVGGGRLAIVLVPLAVVVVMMVVVAACPDAGKVSLRSARSARTRREQDR